MMRGVGLTLVACLVAALSACGDDAPDQAIQAERAATLAAEYRAGTNVLSVAPSSPATIGSSTETIGSSLPSSGTSPAGTSPDNASPDNASPDNASPAGSSPGENAVPTGVVVPVVALDNSFRPAQLTIHVGDEVLWENRGRNEHNILNIESADEGFAADGAWGIDVDAFQPGDVFAHVFTEPGNYRYYCTIHGNTEVGMVGTIVVEA